MTSIAFSTPPATCPMQRARRWICWPISHATHRPGQKRSPRGSARCRPKTRWRVGWRRCPGWARYRPVRLRQPPPMWPPSAARATMRRGPGLTPQAHSSGGKERLGRISRAGNRYLRRLLHLGAMMSHRAPSVQERWRMISARRGRREGASGKAPDWLDRMPVRKPVKVVAIALANRMARTIRAFAMALEPMATHGSLRRGDSYRTTVA